MLVKRIIKIAEAINVNITMDKARQVNDELMHTTAFNLDINEMIEVLIVK